MIKLADKLDQFFDDQINSWPLLKKNVSALDNVITNKYHFEHSRIEVHFNPERIKSSSAKVDKKSIEERACFLCDENRPVEQGNVLFLDRWKILCNPYPVLKKHYTIVRTEHTLQLIYNSFEDMLLLAKEVSEKLTIFYNGPKHGASAPDHLHFQAVTSDILPIEKLIDDNDLNTPGSFQYYEFLPQKFYLMIDENLEHVKDEFQKLYKKLHEKDESEEEPPLNLIAKHDGKNFIVILFERKQHRPKCFYKEEPERILISPATLDMAGLFVLPRKEDLNKINKEIIENIYSEVLG